MEVVGRDNLPRVGHSPMLAQDSLVLVVHSLVRKLGSLVERQDIQDFVEHPEKNIY